MSNESSVFNKLSSTYWGIFIVIENVNSSETVTNKIAVPLIPNQFVKRWPTNSDSTISTKSIWDTVTNKFPIVRLVTISICNTVTNKVPILRRVPNQFVKRLPTNCDSTISTKSICLLKRYKRIESNAYSMWNIE